jgi:mutator protein MutT
MIRVSVAALIFNAEGAVFLSKRGAKARNERGCWEFPGGKIEFGEALHDALKREIREEYGIEIVVRRLFNVYESIDDENGEHWVSVVYLVDHAGGEPSILEPHKCDAIGWYALDALPEPTAVLTRREALEYLEANF